MALIKNEYQDILLRSLGVYFFYVAGFAGLWQKRIVAVKHRRHYPNFTHNQCGAKRHGGQQYFLKWRNNCCIGVVCGEFCMKKLYTNSLN